MSKSLKNRSEQERPELPQTPYLCASCRFGLIITAKVPLHDRIDRSIEPWLPKDVFEWEWEARCNNPRIAGRYPETFSDPVVDCEGFEARSLDAREGEPAEKAGSESSEESR